MLNLRRVNLIDYPGIQGASAEFFAIAELRRPILIHVCLLDAKEELLALKHSVSGKEPDAFDSAFCCWKRTEEHDGLPGEFLLLAFYKAWCFPNVIYHEAFHAGIYASRGTDCNEEELIDFVQAVQAFCIGVLAAHLRQSLPPGVEDRLGTYYDAKMMPGYNGQSGSSKEVMWRPRIRPNLSVHIALFNSIDSMKNVIPRLAHNLCPFSEDTYIHLAILSNHPAIKCPDILTIYFHRACFNFNIIMHQGMHAALLAFNRNVVEKDEEIVQMYDQLSMVVGGQFCEFI